PDPTIKAAEDYAKVMKEIADLNKQLETTRQSKPNLPPMPVGGVPGRAHGGLIGGPPAPGPGRDNQIIAARSDEFVMNPMATRLFYSHLGAMNAGIKGYAEGGHVTNNNTIQGGISVNMPKGTSGTQVRDFVRQLNRELSRGSSRLGGR